MIPQPYHHHQTVFAPPGTLRVYPQQAIITGETCVIGSASLKIFIKARLGAGLQESVVDTKNDRRPTWTQELGFRRKDESTLKFEFYHKNLLFNPTFFGECVINLDPVFIQGQITIATDIVYKCHKIGTFQARFKWEPDGGQPRPVSSQSHLPPSMNGPLVFTGRNLGSPDNYPQPQPLQPQPQTFVIPVQPQMLGRGESQVYVINPPTSVHQPVNVNYGQNVQGTVVVNANQNSGYNPQPQPILAPPREESKIQEEPADPDLPEDKKCVICLDRKKAGAFYRCGHNCCCASCGQMFIGKPCPICRQIVADFIKVFDS